MKKKAIVENTPLGIFKFQILIGVHSVCQPLCYFRMKEFRRLACCLGVSTRTRRYNGSGSSGGSIFAQGVVGVGGGGTQSNRSAKSIGSFKANTNIGTFNFIKFKSLSYHTLSEMPQGRINCKLG